MLLDVCDLLVLIVDQPYALVEISLQGAQLCDIGAGHTYPKINQRIRTYNQIASLKKNTDAFDQNSRARNVAQNQ